MLAWGVGFWVVLSRHEAQITGFGLVPRIGALTSSQRVWDTVHFHVSSIGYERMITLRSALFNLMFFLVTFAFTMAAAVVRWVSPQHVRTERRLSAKQR
jgi:hypothetical protein